MVTQLQVSQVAEKYAERFANELQLRPSIEEKCERSCLLWLKEHWAQEAEKAQIRLQQAKDHRRQKEDSTEIHVLLEETQFKNTTAQVYSKLFDGTEKGCETKDFQNCPCLKQRNDLLNRGFLANTFMTLLQKAVYYSLLETHPIDSGLVNEEYQDVYGIDLTSFQDLEASLTDGRFEKVYQAVVKRASELAGLHSSSTGYSKCFP